MAEEGLQARGHKERARTHTLATPDAFHTCTNTPGVAKTLHEKFYIIIFYISQCTSQSATITKLYSERR